MITKRKFVLVMIISMFSLLAVACSPSDRLTENVASGSASFGPAPTFEKTTIKGESFSLQDNIDSGKPTVVYFMASTCTKCAKNWAAVNEVYPEYEDKVDFIAISVDPTDTSEVLTNLAQEKNFIFETIAGDPDLAVEYEVFKQTAKFAVNSEGEIIDRHDGVFTEEEWRQFFDKLV